MATKNSARRQADKNCWYCGDVKNSPRHLDGGCYIPDDPRVREALGFS